MNPELQVEQSSCVFLVSVENIVTFWLSWKLSSSDSRQGNTAALSDSGTWQCATEGKRKAWAEGPLVTAQTICSSVARSASCAEFILSHNWTQPLLCTHPAVFAKAFFTKVLHHISQHWLCLERLWDAHWQQDWALLTNADVFSQFPDCYSPIMVVCCTACTSVLQLGAHWGFFFTALELIWSISHIRSADWRGATAPSSCLQQKCLCCLCVQQTKGTLLLTFCRIISVMQEIIDRQL